MRKLSFFILVLLLGSLAAGCTPPAVAGEDGGGPSAPGGLSLDGEDSNQAGGNDTLGASPAESAQLPPGISGSKPDLFPSDWTQASPFPICPNPELTLTGASYLENGQLMVSFYDPNPSEDPRQEDAPIPPMFLDVSNPDGDQLASYDCTKHPSAPDLVYCFGEPLPPGSLVQANFAFGRRTTVNIYDPAGSLFPDGEESPDMFLAGYPDLDSSLLFPAFFGPNRDNLARIWGTNGTSLDPALNFIFASQAAEGLGFSGEIKTLIGLFNVLSACQVASDLGAPLPGGCEELGSAYYQPQTDCQGFPSCYESCAAEMFLPSPDGQSSLSKKELLDYLETLPPESLPASCLDYQYWSQSVLFTGSSGEGEGSDWTDSVSSLFWAACISNPGSFFCDEESGEGEDDQEVESIPVELKDAVMTGACMLDPGNPLCVGEFGGGSDDEVLVLSRCAVEIGWSSGISTYGDAADLLTFLLSAGPSLSANALPASCQDALEEAGEPFETGVAGMLSGVLYSGAVNSCIYQASFVAPPQSDAGGSAGGSGGGGSGSGSTSGTSKPSCGPGLIPVLWKGSWICIPQN